VIGTKDIIKGEVYKMKKPEINEVETDVLVVGGGAAGTWAAIRAKELCPKVILVEKAKIARSGATTWTHGILAPVSEDIIYPAMKEFVEWSVYLCNQKRLELVLRGQTDRIRKMTEWGVPFDKDSSGKMFTQPGKMMNLTRTCYSHGIPLMEKMKEQALKVGVKCVEKVMITDLLTSDGQYPTEGRVVGAFGLNTRTGQPQVFKAKTVILCNGPVGSKLHNGFADNLTGDGHAAALRVGAEMSGMEFGHQPYFPIWGRQFQGFPPGVVNTYKGKLMNALGEDVVEKYYPGKTSHELTRYQSGFAMTKETLEGRGPVYFDLSHWNDEIIARLRRIVPHDLRGFDELGLDPRTQRLEVVAIANGPMWANTTGGVHKDLNGSSSVPGLFAAGSAANEGVNYSDSSGLAQAGCYTGGYIAGENAAKLSKEIGEAKINADQVKFLTEEKLLPLGRDSGPTPDEIYTMINKVMIPAQYSFFKHERRIKFTLAEVKRAQEEMLPKVKATDVHELIKANEARNWVSTVEALYNASLERKESRHCHNREEYPYRDDVDWLKWVIIKKGKKGFTTRLENILADDYPIKPEKRTKIPAAVQFTWKGQ
jgi:succinate dehydrogenase / fumarate reductase flavoprotein subunit